MALKRRRMNPRQRMRRSRWTLWPSLATEVGGIYEGEYKTCIDIPFVLRLRKPFCHPGQLQAVSKCPFSSTWIFRFANVCLCKYNIQTIRDEAHLGHNLASLISSNIVLPNHNMYINKIIPNHNIIMQP